MKIANVNKDVCIGCGACTQIAEEVFTFGEDGLAEVKEDVKVIKEEDLESSLDAMESCPVGAISVEDKDEVAEAA